MTKDEWFPCRFCGRQTLESPDEPVSKRVCYVCYQIAEKRLHAAIGRGAPIHALLWGGIYTVDELAHTDDAWLLARPHIGPKLVARIRAAVPYLGPVSDRDWLDDLADVGILPA